MAEYNIFLGTARRSVGDVTLSRRKGKQIARVRVRTIANPQSDAQCAQRNFVAPVARFYAPFRVVLDRSFEGLNTDLSYAKFQKVNINLAKTNGWYMLKGSAFAPLPYQLSRGSLMPVYYEVHDSGGYKFLQTAIGGMTTSPSTIGDYSSVFIAAGYKSGDVVTCITVCLADDGSYFPSYCQFVVNAYNTAAMSSVSTASCVLGRAGTQFILSSTVGTLLAGAVIVSRYSGRTWLRSTQFLACDDTIVTALVSEAQRDASIASYKTNVNSGGGGVYPGGGTTYYNVAAADGRALLFIEGVVLASIVSVGGVHWVMVKPANLANYYYMKYSDGSYVVADSSDATSPSDWYLLSSTPDDTDTSNTINWAAGSNFHQWLLSVGYPST